MGQIRGLDLRTLSIRAEGAKFLSERQHPAFAKWAPSRGGKILALVIILVALAGLLLIATPTLLAPDNLVPQVGSSLSAEADEGGTSGTLLFCALILFSIPAVRWGLLPAPCEIPVLRSVYCSDLERPG